MNHFPRQRVWNMDSSFRCPRCRRWLSDNKIGLYTGNSARMIIDNGGNVGIGTTTPNSLLHVSGTTPKLYLSDTSASANQKHWFMQSTGGSLTIGTTTDGLVDTSSYRALTILQNGNVGIGTTSPNTTLQISNNTASFENLLHLQKFLFPAPLLISFSTFT